MNFPADHPIWPIIRYSVLGVVLTVMCATLYSTGIVPKDIILIIAAIASIMGVDVTKSYINKT